MRKFGFECLVVLFCAMSLSVASCRKTEPSGEDTGRSDTENAAIPAIAEGAADANSYRDEQKAFVPKQHDNIYHLIDPRTQMLILQYKHPDGWMTGSNAQWLTNSPNMPHHWFTWAASPDGMMKFAFSSDIQMAGMGRIDQNPMLNDPNVLANKMFVPAAQQDYNLKNVSVKEAKFLPDPNAQQKQQKIAQDVTQYGLRTTDVRCLIYSAVVTGERAGQQFFVSYMAPVNIIEMRPGMNYTHTFEMVQLFSWGGPIGSEGKLEEIMNASVATIELNPNFIQFRNQVAQMQTQDAIAEMNKKYEILHQQHLKNMADSDARLNNFLNESDRKHAQVMGRGGSGGSAGGSGSMLDKWDEYIKDVDMVQNPNSGEDMFIDNRYEHAWINSDNEVMYMDSSLFNPNENAAFNHREWKKVR